MSAPPVGPGGAVTPKEAATLVLTRDRRPPEASPEVLLVRRDKKARFAAGAHVFPGGVLEEMDYSPTAFAASKDLSPSEAQSMLRNMEPPEKALGYFHAAIRETFEEVGLLLGEKEKGCQWNPTDGEKEELQSAREAIHRGELDFYGLVSSFKVKLTPGKLVYFSHWITPEAMPRRFDTRFFMAEVSSRAEARPDRMEVFEHCWLLPQEAMEQEKNGTMRMMPPTLASLELLASFSTSAGALAALKGREVATILPTNDEVKRAGKGFPGR